MAALFSQWPPRLVSRWGRIPCAAVSVRHPAHLSVVQRADLTREGNGDEVVVVDGGDLTGYRGWTGGDAPSASCSTRPNANFSQVAHLTEGHDAGVQSRVPATTSRFTATTAFASSCPHA
jgi:hypothetical protein